jgi:exonuclease 3'-5' domain-containing protein 1
LKSILETGDVTKYFFDVRNDADALYNLFGIRLSGVRDIQLWEMASRTFPKRMLSGLATCVTKDAPLSEEQVTDWKAAKALGTPMFDHKLGGSYEVFNQRPCQKKLSITASKMS